MKKKASKDAALPDETECPIARSQKIVGDRWTVLILRELFMGNHRFEEIQAQTEATPQMLSSRLKKLEADGVIERRKYSKRPIRHEYVLTDMGQDLYSVVLALRAWGETWCKPKGRLAVQQIHIPCGHDPGLGAACQSCGATLRKSELKSEMSPAYSRERELRRAAFKTK
jgi:DNA-binding HxlR family transcriptional regulator